MKPESKRLKVIIEKHADGFVAYPLGMHGVVVGEGASFDEALANVKSAIRAHVEVFGKDVLDWESAPLEVFVAETAIASDPRRKLLAERLQTVETRIASACARSGRKREEVTLVAVTKTITPEMAALLPELSILDLGENRPQELWRKAAALPANVRWHLIGHLQRNKIERTLPLVHLIHSVDSVRLLEELEKQGRPIDVLLEVNASQEANKNGFAPEQVASLAAAIQPLRQVRVRGLMTMAALADDPERCRPTFRLLRDLRDGLAQQVGPPHALEHLSMGMTNDFEVAIEEGATLVRIGSALFGDAS